MKLWPLYKWNLIPKVMLFMVDSIPEHLQNRLGQSQQTKVILTYLSSNPVQTYKMNGL